MKKVLLVVALTATVLVGCSKQPNSESNNENMTQPAIAQPVAEEKVMLKRVLNAFCQKIL